MSSAFIPSPQVRATLEAMNTASSRGEPFFFILDFELRESLFIASPLEQREPQVYFDFPSARTLPPEASVAPVELSLEPEDYASYLSRYEIIHRGLLRGDSFLSNLTLRTPITCQASLEQIYLTSQARYRVLLPGRFVSFSPECFVSIREGKISTHPMKGTIDATLPDAAERLRTDYKEGCEHCTIVDLMRNDLNRVATEVEVARFKYLTRLHTSRGDLLQMSSEIRGRIQPKYLGALGDLLLELLPAGSISGAPKEKTVELIRQAEDSPRGFYTGVCGYYDGSELDSAVLIRYIEQDYSGQLYYRSGGGVTINSQPKDEYEECIQKIYIPQ
mgnify:FL=1|jgi:hypothetical protein